MGELLSQLGTLIGALGLGTVFGNWVSGAKDRRASMASVASTLAVLETMRASDPDVDDLADFRKARRDFRTAAIVANLPPEPIRVYLRSADFCYRLSSHKEYPAPGVRDSRPMTMEEAQTVLTAHAEAARLVAQMVTSNPLYRRLKGRRRPWSKSRAIEKRIERVVTEAWERDWRRAGEVI